MFLLKEFRHHMRGVQNTFPSAVRVKGQTKQDAIGAVKAKKNHDLILKTKAEVKDVQGQVAKT
jgi:hypothetical protein